MYGTEAQDIYTACKEGDESYVRQWLARAENDVNRGWVFPIYISFKTKFLLELWKAYKTIKEGSLYNLGTVDQK